MFDTPAIAPIESKKVVFPDTVISAYSSPFPVVEDSSTMATINIATLVNCKTLPTKITGLNGITPQDMDFKSNPGLGCYAYNSRGESGSTIELFG